jgi:hypothetical protein
MRKVQLTFESWLMKTRINRDSTSFKKLKKNLSCIVILGKPVLRIAQFVAGYYFEFYVVLATYLKY